MNIQSAIIEGTNILKDKYIQTAILDTEILMAKVLGRDRKYIVLNSKKNLNDENFEIKTLRFREISNRSREITR
jgi:release factor glutamine methyltransferase